MSPDDPTSTQRLDEAVRKTSFVEDRVTPIDLKLKLEDQTLTVKWKDGATSAFQLGLLRRHCPCATCRTQREERTLLPILNIKPGQPTPRVTGANLAGNYAIVLQWSDGHDAGIFDFRYLRALDEPRRTDDA